jgi:Zn finger protein HypA/HybF involved in hydrogenase expression
MHEASLVAELVEACERHAGGAAVALVRVRHAATVSEEQLRQAFRLLTADGPLASAELELERVEQRLECPCGFAGVLGNDDLAGPVAVCPSCGAVSPRRPDAELELLELRSAR